MQDAGTVTVVVKDGRAYLVDMSGEPVSVPVANAKAAFQAGYRPEAKDSYNRRSQYRESLAIWQRGCVPKQAEE